VHCNSKRHTKHEYEYIAQKGLPFSLQDYFELIDWAGRVIRDDKKGAILADFSRFNLNFNHFGRRFYHVVGAVEVMRQFSNKIGQWWVQGMGCFRGLYAT